MPDSNSAQIITPLVSKKLNVDLQMQVISIKGIAK